MKRVQGEIITMVTRAAYILPPSHSPSLTGQQASFIRGGKHENERESPPPPPGWCAKRDGTLWTVTHTYTHTRIPCTYCNTIHTRGKRQAGRKNSACLAVVMKQHPQKQRCADETPGREGNGKKGGPGVLQSIFT